MRATFLRTLVELAERDDRVVFLTGDLGYTVVEPFAERFPDRYFNVGVAEQNLVGLSSGLAEAGYLPFVYSIASFASMRAYEFIRNGPVMQELPVRIIGVGGGFEYGYAGPTHYALEDVAIMRAQPGLAVVVPADAPQAEAALRRTWDLDGAVYYRLGKDEQARVPGLEGRFRLGHLEVVREGADVALLAMGPIARDAVAAAERLATEGVEATVAVVASVNPPPLADLKALLASVPVAVSVEAHYVSGGLGSLLSEIVAEEGLGTRIARCGVRTLPASVSGTESLMLAAHGLSPEAIAGSARHALGAPIPR